MTGTDTAWGLRPEELAFFSLRGGTPTEYVHPASGGAVLLRSELVCTVAREASSGEAARPGRGTPPTLEQRESLRESFVSLFR